MGDLTAIVASISTRFMAGRCRPMSKVTTVVPEETSKGAIEVLMHEDRAKASEEPGNLVPSVLDIGGNPQVCISNSKKGKNS